MTTYKVKISDATATPIVVDGTGMKVPNARVTAINFPKGTQNTPNGQVYYISGPGQADIEVDGLAISGIPLC